MNILVCSIVRNRANALPFWKLQLEKLASWYPEYTFDLAVYENDSEDGSDEYISSLSEVAGYRDVYTRSEKRDWPYFGSIVSSQRVAQLADARNTTMSLAKSMDSYDYVMWIEPDIVYPEKDARRIIDSCITEKLDIASGYSWINQKGRVYDTWAMRSKDSHPHHPYAEGLIPVHSTFHCFAVYNAKGFAAGAEFDGSDCDTAAVCFNFAKKGFDKIFIAAESWIGHFDDNLFRQMYNTEINRHIKND